MYPKFEYGDYLSGGGNEYDSSDPGADCECFSTSLDVESWWEEAMSHSGLKILAQGAAPTSASIHDIHADHSK